MAAPYLVRIFSDLWVVPQHIVKDRLADGSWTLDPKTAVSAGPYKMESWERGKQLNLVANDKYTGPFPPMFDKIIVYFMDPSIRFTAYKNNELDIIGHLMLDDLTPAGMAEVNADPALKSALLAAYRAQPYAPPSAADSAAAIGPDAISALLHQGVLVRLSTST